MLYLDLKSVKSGKIYIANWFFYLFYKYGGTFFLEKLNKIPIHFAKI